MTHRTRIFAGLLAALSLTGCSHRWESSVGTQKNPIVVILSPAHAPASAQALRAIEDHLRSKTGMAVEVRVAATPVEAIERFGLREADAGILSLDGYLLAHEEYGVQAALQALRRGTSAEFEAVVLARADGPVKSLQDLAGRPFGFVDPYSVSGFILPAAFLHDKGIQVEPVLMGSHSAALKAVLDKSVPAAATFAPDKLDPKLRILAKTGVVPNEPLAVRKGLQAKKREALVAAFLSLGESPEGKAALSSVADITGLRPVPEGAYRSAHDLLRSAEKSVYDLIPEGWEIRKLNRSYLPD